MTHRYSHPGFALARRFTALTSVVGLAAIALSTASFADSSVGRGDPGLTGSYPGNPSAPLSLMWKYTSTYFGGNPSAPAIAGGNAYFCSGSRVYSVDVATGAMKWRYPADAPLATTIHSTPSVSEGTVYIGADNGKLYALDAANGHDVWAFDTHSTISESPTIADGVVYFGSGDGLLWAVDAKTGRVMPTWKGGFKMLDDVSGQPAVANGFVYALSADQVVHAVGVATGKERWAYRLTGSVLNQYPVVFDDALYIANGSTLTSLNCRSGSLRWNRILSTDASVAPAINASGVYLITSDDLVLCLDPRTGRDLWKSPPHLDMDVVAPPTLAGGNLYIGTALGGLFAMNGTTGATKWSYVVRPSSTSESAIARTTNIAAPIVVSDNTLYVMTDDGSLSAFSAGAFDTLGPTVTDTQPDSGIEINGEPPLHFEAKVRDEGSGLDLSQLKLMLDAHGVPKKPDGDKGDNVMGYKYDPLTSVLSYDMRESSSAATVASLADGRHTVTIVAADWRGNVTTKAWSFLVDNSLVKLAPVTNPANGVPGSGGLGSGGLGGRGGRTGGGKLGGG